MIDFWKVSGSLLSAVTDKTASCLRLYRQVLVTFLPDYNCELVWAQQLYLSVWSRLIDKTGFVFC